MRFGVNNRIVNASSKIVLLKDGAEVAPTGLLGDGDVDFVVIDQVKIPNSVSALNIASAAGTAGVYDFTISNGASATGRNTVNLEIELGSLRQEAEYSRYAWLFGKRIHFGIEVAASATPTTIAAALEAVINKRIARFNDLPFTVSAAAGVITITLTEMDIVVLSAGVSAADKDGKVIIASTLAATTPPVSPIGLASQVEETVQMLTSKNSLAGAIKADERVDMTATYEQLRVTIPFTDGARPEPAPVGLGAQSGSYDVAFYIKDGQLAGNLRTDVLAILA